MQKDIREEVKNLRDCLASDRKSYGPFPLQNNEEQDWKLTVDKYKETVGRINKNIDTFNLVVPILDRQMIQINLEKEAEKVLIHGSYCKDPNARNVHNEAPGETRSGNVFDFIDYLFKNK